MALWYWNGVFGELYGSAIESRFAREMMEVPAWIDGGPEPSTVSEASFRAERLRRMTSRLSAAYKGVNALLMKQGAQDFRSGQDFDLAVFFDENVDIHHVFPRDWCKKKGFKPSVFDAIANKTPLSSRTNRIIGAVAPSEYIVRLERGRGDDRPISPQQLDAFLVSHLIDPALLRADDFKSFIEARAAALLGLIEDAMDKRIPPEEPSATPEQPVEEPEEVDSEEGDAILAHESDNEGL